jgi:hypothetical protein
MRYGPAVKLKKGTIMKTLLCGLLVLTSISVFAKDCSISLIHDGPNFNTAEIDSLLAKKGYQRIDADNGVFTIVTTVKGNEILNIPIYTFTATAILSENTDAGTVIIDQKEDSEFSKPNGGSIWRAHARSKQEAVKKIVKAMDLCK